MSRPRTLEQGRSRQPRRHDAFPSMRMGQLVGIAMLLVVTSFALSLGYSHFRLQPVSSQALEVIEDAAPSIEHLSAARTELTRMGMYAAEYVARPTDSGSVARADIRAVRDRAQRALDAYRVLPSFPEEAEQLAALDRVLARLDHAVDQALAQADAGALEAAKLSLNGPLHRALLEADEISARLKKVSVEHARTNAERILRARREATFTAMGLGVLSIIVAILATFSVLRMLRGRARLIEEHTRLLALRGMELEAFAGSAAHELKNPLNALALRVQCVRIGRESDRRLRDDLDKVTRLVVNMDRTIDGMLAFARAGASPAAGAHAELAAVLDELSSELRPAADTAGAELRIEGFAPASVACPPALLSSILSNLVGNAIKYVGEGRAVPKHVIVRARERNGVARVEVEDNGPGLPEATGERVFEPFWRLGVSKQPGIGLGLATVKKIVEAYGGRVGVESKLHEGSTFWFELPIARDSARGEGETRSDRSGWNMRSAAR